MMADKIAMMAITTNNSINVNALSVFMGTPRKKKGLCFEAT
jgi:hypothetical protein